ncbi:MAG: PKD domain-containing protein [Fibrobacterota bacterium]|nr:PKD domain-containing protein [Fibrobacterota bacterium]
MLSLKPIKILATLTVAAILTVFWACHLGVQEDKVFMNVKADTTWLAYDSVSVLLKDQSGKTLEVLFHGPLTDIGQLSRLEAGDYQGGGVIIVLVGFKAGQSIKEETRKYDGKTQSTIDMVVIINQGETLNALVLKPNAIKLYTGGAKGTLTPMPSTWADKPLVWSSSDSMVAKVSNGEVSPVKAGTVWITAVGATAKDSAKVTVATDAPILDAGADTVVTLGSTIAFQVKVTQEYGLIEVFKWSLDGDSTWDDSASQYPTEQTIVTSVPKKFPVAATYDLLFYVRDGEGNAVTAVRKLTVSSQVPKITSITKDTTLIAGDSLAFSAKAEVNSGSLKTFSWDYDGDGTFEKRGALTGSSANIAGGYRFAKEGSYKVLLKVEDDAGTPISIQVAIKVIAATVPKPPVANAGKDTAVLAGKRVDLHGSGTDPDGTIAKMEWSIGAEPFTVVSKGDTSFASSDVAGTVKCVLRVTDNDGLSDVDTVTITISKAVPPVLSSVTPGDTIISIKDSLTFSAKAASASPLKGYSWDFNGDGTADVSDILSGTNATLLAGRRFGATGIFNVLLKVEDQQGGIATKSIMVDVRLDNPIVNAGKDTTVAEGTKANLNGVANDSLGSIVKWEWKIGAAAFVASPSGETSFTAPVVPGVVTCVFRATDDDGFSAEDTVLVTVAPSTNANLSDLAIVPGSLAPAFAPATKAYTVSVTAGDSVSITATTAHAKATLTLNGKALASGKASDSLPIIVGANLFTLVATAEDGATKATYALSVTKVESTPPSAPTVSVSVSKTASRSAIWSWKAGGGGNGTYRYKLNNSVLTTGASDTTALAFTGTALANGSNILYVQERNAAGVWSLSGSATVQILAPLEWYPLNGTGTDLGLNANNGVVTGATATPDHAGVAGAALNFNGSSQVATGTASANTGTNMTVSMWIKIPAGISLQYFINNNMSGFGIWSRSGEVGLAISLPSTNSAGGAVSPNVWTHFTGTYDGSNIKVYINGVLANTTAHAGPPIAGSLSNLVIGATGWSGALDEVRFYNKPLTQAEVTALYQGKL